MCTCRVKYEFRHKREVKASCTPKGNEMKIVLIADRGFGFGVLLTVHLRITLVDDQLDAQVLYFIIRLLQSSTCFEQRRAHHQKIKFY